MRPIGVVSKNDIGAIRVKKDQSFVQIREEAVTGFLASVGEAMTLEKGRRLTRLDEAPAFESKGPKPKSKSGYGGRKPTGGKTHRGKEPAPEAKAASPAPKLPRKREYQEGEGGDATFRQPPADRGKPAKPAGKPKGPPPPKGKPSSKKNRARAAAAAKAKGSGKAGSGAGRPKEKPKRGKPPRAGSSQRTK